jgi:Uma2 family endonuclease
MNTTTETHLLTFEEFERMPEKPGKQELIDGELIEMPPAKDKHNKRSLLIYDTLKPAVTAAHARGEAAELGEVRHEAGYKLAGRWLQPDVSITHPGQTAGTDDYLQGSPAIAIEVISRHQRAWDLARKTQLYVENGAREVWHLYQELGYMVIYSGSPSQVRVEYEAISTPLPPGFALILREILGE